MRRIRSKGMKPEIAVRSLVHGLGYRFRLHRRDLPGAPDLVLPRHKKIILVHGCFWHQHPGCREGRVPGTRQDYWQPKLSRNVERDAENEARIRALGWAVLVVWECELKDPADVRDRLARFLRSGSRPRGPAGGRPYLSARAK